MTRMQVSVSRLYLTASCCKYINQLLVSNECLSPVNINIKDCARYNYLRFQDDQDVIKKWLQLLLSRLFALLNFY